MDSTRHFDAPGPPSTIGSALALLRAHGAVSVALMVVVAIVGAAAAGLVFVDRLKTAAIEAAVASTPLSVVVDARATAVEVDALGPLIKALPGIEDAVLRPRDAALQALVANGLPAPDGRNPLPDVWTARLRAGPVTEGATRLAPAVADARRALAALPQVEAVRVDERWVGIADAGIADGARSVSRVVLCGGVLLAGLLAAAVGAGGAALSSAARKSVVTFAVTLIAAVALLVDVVVAVLLAVWWKPAGAGLVEAGWDRFAASSSAPVAAIGLAILAIAAIAAALAPRR